MENLEDLKLLVNELENNTNKEEQIKILQTIGKILITEYEIKVDGIKIEPLWALFYDLCKHGKWHKIQNGNRAGKSQGCLLPIIAY